MSKKELLAELDERGGLRVDPKWRKPMLVQKLLNAEMEADEDGTRSRRTSRPTRREASRWDSV